MGNVIASMAGQKETASEKEETASEKKAGQKEEDKKPLLTDVDEDEDDDEYDVDEDEDDDEYDVLRDGPSADDMFGNCGVLAVLFETPPGHTPYGFAIFEYDAVKLTEPDAWQHIWADFIGDLKAVIWPEAFLNFGCKGDAITDTDVSKDLSLMIQNHVADGQTLAVGNEGYEKVIQDRLKISCVYSPAVKELMWGLMIQIKNFLPVINSEMINLDRFPMSDGMIFFLKSHKFDINPHMMVTKKIIELAGVMYECDHCVNKYDAVLDMFADELMEISGITTSDWDSLKLVTALKIICEPEDEIRNARKLFSEQQLEKLMKDAPQYKDVILKDPALEIYKEMNSARNLSVKVSRVMVRLLEQAKKAYENEQGGKAASDPEICPPRKKICLGFAPVMNELKERQVPPTIAPVDALQRCTQISTHPLNMMNRPGISSMDIHPLKVGQPSGQEGYVSTSFHQGGLILGTGTLDGSVKIWDVKTQTAGLDGVKIWDLRTYGDPVAFDLSNYNSDTPINAGNCVRFCASLSPSSSLTIEDDENRIVRRNNMNQMYIGNKDWSALLFGLLAAFHGNKQGLDLIAKTMDADDKCWTIHLAYRPELVNFRNGQPANLEQQDVMLRKAHVTGESAAIPGEETGEKYEGAILLDGAEAGKKTTLGKRKLGGFFDGSSCGKDDSVPTMKEFFRMVRESGVEEGTDLMFTACKLALKREHRELLGAFATNAGRLDYLTRTHAEMNK